MGKSSDTQTTTQSNEPYSGAKPLLNKGMGDALKAYSGSGLVNPSTMSTVIPYDEQTTGAMSGLKALGAANTGGNGLSGQFQDIINGGGYNADQRTAMDGLRSTANSTYDMNANPGFAGVLKQAQEAAGNSVNGMASGLGRYGSGTHQGVMGKTVGDLTDRMVSSDFNNWLQRKDAAGQQLFNGGQQGQENLGAAYEGAQSAYNPALQVGGMNEDLAGRIRNDELRIDDGKRNDLMAEIQALMGVAGGAGAYGTQTNKAQMPNNTMSNIGGGILGGLSLLNSF